MSLPAGMQWDLLPPLSARTTGALIAGVLEPAYDIAGDAFDYAVNGDDLSFATGIIGRLAAGPGQESAQLGSGPAPGLSGVRGARAAGWGQPEALTERA
jgi:hypothetical protein